MVSEPDRSSVICDLLLNHLPNIGSQYMIFLFSRIIPDHLRSDVAHLWSSQPHQQKTTILVAWSFLDLWRFFHDLLIIRGRSSTIFCEYSFFFNSYHLGCPKSWIWIWSSYDQCQKLYKTSLIPSPHSDLCQDHLVGPTCASTHWRQGRLSLPVLWLLAVDAADDFWWLLLHAAVTSCYFWCLLLDCWGFYLQIVVFFLLLYLLF